MDSEEVINLDSRGIYSQNRSSSSDPNLGSRGKLNSEQLEERMEFHARRHALGKPSVQEICDHWLKEYDITINPRSEREWAEKHDDEILDLQVKLEKDGKIEVVHSSNAALTNTLAHGAKEKVNIIKRAHREIRDLHDKLRNARDVFALVGLTKEKFQSLPTEEKKEARKDLDIAIKIRDMNIKEMKEFSAASTKHCENLTNFISLAKDINGSDFMVDKRVKDAMRVAGQQKALDKAVEEDEIDPLMEITDEHRS